MKHKPTKEELIEHYRTNSVSELRKMYKVSDRKIREWIKEYQIPKSIHTSKKAIDAPSREELYSKHWVENKSLSEISFDYGVSRPTVRKWFKKLDIETRTHKEMCEVHAEKVSHDIPEYNEFKLAFERNTIRELAEIYHVSKARIAEWRDYYNIEDRSLSDSCVLAKQKSFEENRLITKSEFESIYEKYGSINGIVASGTLSRKTIKRIMDYYGIDVVFPTRSAVENELLEYCKQIRPDVKWKSNDRTVIAPYEIDIYSPDLKFAIEYCGLYWHSEISGGKHKNYHRTKYEKLRDKGIQLITVFESDNMDKVKASIQHKIASTIRRIYARKTSVSKIDSSTAKAFHEKHHIHGYSNSSVHFALTDDDSIIVQVASFSKSRFNSQYQWECARNTIASARVIGGTSKLFTEFKRKYDPNSIITYSDLRFGEGNSYKHCGFIRESDSKPNYWYFHKGTADKLYSRIAFQKHKLPSKLVEYDESLTESENMFANGYDRIFDCGNAVWTWRKG